MKISSTEVAFKDLRPGDLFVRVPQDWAGLIEASKTQSFPAATVEIRLHSPLLRHQQEERVYRLARSRDPEEMAESHSARPVMEPGETARRKYWAVHNESGWPPHEGRVGDPHLKARKAINYTVWGRLLGFGGIKSATELSPEAWGILATIVDRIHEGELTEPKEWEDWREGRNPLAN